MVRERFPGYLDLVCDFLRERGLVSLFAGEGVLRWFLGALALPVPPPGQEIVEDVTDGLAACPGEGERGDAGLAGGMRDADGDGEGDPVRVNPGRAGRFGPQGAQGLVDGEEREQFLATSSGDRDRRMNDAPRSLPARGQRGGRWRSSIAAI
jgi:hypothetical protein